MAAPNRFDVVRKMNETHPGLIESDPNRFTQLVAATLAAEDPRWGRYLNIRGNQSLDVVAFKGGELRGVDIIIGARGDNPRISWQDTARRGTWKYVKPIDNDDDDDNDTPDDELEDIRERLARLEEWASSFND